MFKSFLSLLSVFIFISIVLSGCATAPIAPSAQQELTLKQRTNQLLQQKKWQVKGKIAFIEQVTNAKDQRQSATLTWKVNQKENTQKLNLTSYLGINVLQLESSEGHHLIKVDGKSYQGTDLPKLLYSLTGLPLPTNALHFWLKGLPYHVEDKLVVNPTTQLPEHISSYYHNALWQINYANYKAFNGIEMPTKITLHKENLVIKVAVYNWTFDE